MPDDRWLTVAEIADHLGVTKDSVYDWITTKGMPGHKVGRLWRFQVSEIDEWVRMGKAAPEAVSVTTRPAPKKSAKRKPRGKRGP